jgi:predicted transcriptional regulator
MRKQNKTEALNIKVSKAIKNKLQAIALKRDISLAQVVREYIVKNNSRKCEQNYKRNKTQLPATNTGQLQNA